MSGSNGVVRIGRKGIRKFAFGEDGAPFEVDVVVAFQAWVCIDNEFRERTDDRVIATGDMPDYHRAAVDFAMSCVTNSISVPDGITTAEALDFIARLRECYDEVAVFFQPRLRDGPESQDSSEAELRFSEEVKSPDSTRTFSN